MLTVFLALPWLGVEYVRELERVLRDAQERTLAGTAQAVATALHDRPRLFATPPDPIATFARDRAADSERRLAAAVRLAGDRADPRRPVAHDRAHLGDRPRRHRARPRRHAQAAAAARRPESFWARRERATVGRLYPLVLEQPTDDFSDDAATQGAPQGRDVEGALAGILTTDRRRTSDGKAVLVSAAHPVWVGDEVRGVVIAEETGNAVLAERNRAFERLFNIVLAVLLVGSLALTAYATAGCPRASAGCATTRSARSTSEGRVRGPLASSGAGDEIGDLSRSFSQVLARLSEYASYQEKMASRLSHELRTPIAVVRSSLDNLKATPPADAARVYMARAQEGLARLTQILTRMTEAARLEQSLSDVDRERFDLVPVVTSCVEGFRLAYPDARIEYVPPALSLPVDGSPDLVAQMLDKLVANAAEFANGGPIAVTLGRGVRGPADRGQRRPAAARGHAGSPVRVDGVGAPRGRARRAAPGARALHRAGDRAVPRRQRQAANKHDGTGVALPSRCRSRRRDLPREHDSRMNAKRYAKTPHRSRTFASKTTDQHAYPTCSIRL